MTTTVQTTKGFYENLGFSKYLALDVNQRMDAMVCDLNYPVERIGRFDLVTDNGTGEHLFNQYQVWKNHHDLTKVGGVLLKIMPFKDWVNHGFYNFNPIVYRDVAAANDYQWLFFWICDRNHTPEDQDHSNRAPFFVEKRPADLLKFANRNWDTDLYMVAAWQKTTDAAFEMPLQGKYKKDVSDGQLRLDYNT